MKIISNITAAVVVLIAAASSASAQLVTYTFGSTAAPVVTPNQVADHLSAGVFAGLDGSPGTGTGSPTSSGAYFAASGWDDPAPGSNYFTFTLTPEEGYQFSTASLSFDYRATGTGPATLSVYSSADSYGSALAAFSTTHDSAWHSSGLLTVSLDNITATTSFRIYGSDASSALGTLRVDNVTLNGSVTPVPEPSTYSLFGGFAALGFVAFRRLRSRDATRPTESIIPG